MKKEVDNKGLVGIGIVFIASGAGTAIVLGNIGGYGLFALGIVFLIVGSKK